MTKIKGTNSEGMTKIPMTNRGVEQKFERREDREGGKKRVNRGSRGFRGWESGKDELVAEVRFC
jgi:hypothetical protein